jgi:phytanoyl-CoA hydroxylase
MSSTDYRPQFDADGFVVVRSFLPEADFAELNRELDRYIHNVVPTLPDGDAFYEDRARPDTLKQLSRIEQDPFFKAYLQHPVWNDMASALLGEPVDCQGAEWFNKPPATNHITPPHQDNYYFCLTPPQVLTMWLALDNVDEENGCLRYVRGSHRTGLRPHGRTKTLGFSQGIPDYGPSDRAQEIAIQARPNDVLIHHGDTIHRADANRSATRHRRSFALVFRGQSARRDPAAYQKYLDSARTQHQEIGLQVS